VVACGSSKAQSFRIGILSDCYGPFSGANELNVASAELPLIERGAKLLGRKPSDGVGPVAVAGRRVELLVGCVAGTDEVIPEARRLVEEGGAQAIVGPEDPGQGMALREYARRRPETAFLIQPSAAPELTLIDPARNVFRFTLDAAQSVAGVGGYAYRQLGWRTAAVVGDDVPFAWEEAAGFVAESARWAAGSSSASGYRSARTRRLRRRGSLAPSTASISGQPSRRCPTS
jgi:branched-chain amino acid transport system substrate-binding protein